MTNQMMLERTSNLVMPTHYIELDHEEMAYVEGGISLSAEGLYISNADIFAITMVVGANPHAVATAISATTSWICSTGIGAFIWGVMAISSFAIAVKAISAVSQGKGLMLSIEWTKVWFLKIATGLSLDVR